MHRSLITFRLILVSLWLCLGVSAVAVGNLGLLSGEDFGRGQWTSLDVDGAPPAFSFTYDNAGRVTRRDDEIGSFRF